MFALLLRKQTARQTEVSLGADCDIERTIIVYTEHFHLIDLLST